MVGKITGQGLLDNVVKQGTALRAALNDRFGEHPHIGDIRGRGLFLGMEFVAERDGKKPFDPGFGFNKRFKKAAMDAGLVCYPMGGTIDGHRGDHVLLAPPFIIDDNHIGEIVDKLDSALGATLTSL